MQQCFIISTKSLLSNTLNYALCYEQFVILLFALFFTAEEKHLCVETRVADPGGDHLDPDQEKKIESGSDRKNTGPGPTF